MFLNFLQFTFETKVSRSVTVKRVPYHISLAEGAVEQEALGSTAQQHLVSDHGTAQHLPTQQTNTEQKINMGIQLSSFVSCLDNSVNEMSCNVLK